MSSDTEQNVFLTQGNEHGVDLHAHDGAAGGGELVAPGGGSGVDGSLGLSPNEHLSQSTRLHHKLREMKEMDDALALMKSDYAERIRAVKDGESKFLIKQHNIIKYLKRFKLFILESDTKRARAEKKESEEHRQRNLKMKEIESHRLQFLSLQSTRSDLKTKNDYYKQNKNYLESVKDAVPEQYGEIDELMVRFQILKQTNLDLTEANRIVSDKVEKITSDLQNLYKTKQNDILVKNSKFAHLLQKLELVTNETSRVENEVADDESRTQDLNRYFCEVQMAIKNIYARTMSSLPSKKAATQMKKRMQQNAQANKEQAQAQAASGQSGAAAAEAANSSGSGNAPGTARSGTAGSAGAGAFDSDLSSDEEEGGSSSKSNQQNQQNQQSTQQQSGSESPHSSSAHSSLNSSKNVHVRLHLIQLLDAIAERLGDLQFIVDSNHNQGVQTLREGGFITQWNQQAAQQQAAHGGFQGQNTGNQTDRARRAAAGGGPGASGAGSGSGSRQVVQSASGDVAAASRGSKHQRFSPTPGSAANKSRKLKAGGPGSDSESDLEASSSDADPSSHPSSQGGLRPKLSPSESRAELEKKFRNINAQLASTGYLKNVDTKDIPAHQIAVTRPGDRKKRAQAKGGFPPIKTAGAGGGSGSAKPTPRSDGSALSPRR